MGICWLSFLVTYFIYHSLSSKVLNIMFRVQQAFYLLLIFSISANINNINDSKQIIGLILGIVVLLYNLACLIYVAN